MEGGSIPKHHKRHNVFQWRRCRWHPVSSRPKINQITLCHHFALMSQCNHLSHNKAHFLICNILTKTKKSIILGSLDIYHKIAQILLFSITAEYTRNIAFSAKLTQIDQSGVLKFVPSFTVGGGFNAETSVFTAPVSGTYFFTVVIVNLLGSSVTDRVDGGSGNERIMPLYRLYQFVTFMHWCA